MTDKTTPARQRRAETAPVQTSAEIVSTAMPIGEHPYLMESSTFARMVEQQRNRAIATISELYADIDHLQAEIDQRRRRVDDLELIVAAADAAIGPIATRNGSQFTKKDPERIPGDGE